ncbi:MAG: DUF2721 domain-containing protein [Gammaproteobacteria bacterium]|nr:DUF2721 domain-containing protein [Gammaproteobacteria bacterium]
MLDTSYTIARAIQLSVAPVFLLTGIAAMLSVLNSRLACIIDRLRFLEQARASAGSAQGHGEPELKRLARRAALMHRAIALSTCSALCISAAIAVIFLSFFFGAKTSTAVASLFVTATLSFMVSLLHFLREMQLASRTVRPEMAAEVHAEDAV